MIDSETERAEFLADLMVGFARQDHGTEDRGAHVVSARILPTPVADEDFALEVTFHALPQGPLRTDTIEGVRNFMRHCNAATAADLADFWSVTLDEHVLAS